MDRRTSKTIYQATKDCRQRFNQYRDYTKHSYDVKGEMRTTSEEWIDNRIADFNLWASGIGALATNRASLDARLEGRSDIRNMVVDLLQLLDMLIKDCIEFAQDSAAKKDQITTSMDAVGQSTSQTSLTRSSSGSSFDSDSSDAGIEKLPQAKHKVDDVLDQLARLTFAIRQSSTHARLQKADKSKKDRDEDDLRCLETHLRTILLASRLPLNEILSSADKLHEIELTDIESRLIRCNLKRRHRFLYQQAHSRRLAVRPKTEAIGLSKSTDTMVSPKRPQPQRLPVTVQEANYAETAVSTAVEQSAEHRTDNSELSRRTDTTATALPNQQIHEQVLQSEHSATRISITIGKVNYPSAPEIGDQRMFKCPCCCQTLPIIYTERSRWKKHLAEDLAPYTCILPHCTRPEDIYITREAWQSHLQNEHRMHEYWECFSCKDVPVYQDKEEFTMHLLHDHQDTILPDQIPMLVSDLRYSIPVDIDSCPLCNYSEPGTIDLDRNSLLDHIAEHIHDFSLRALPWPADDKDVMPNQEAKIKSRDWIPTHTAQEVIVEQSYTEPLNVDHDRYQQWLQSWMSRIRALNTYHHIPSDRDAHCGNYFDSNQYFDNKSSTDDDVDTSRDYQKLLDTEKVSLYWNVPFLRNPSFRGQELVLETSENLILSPETTPRIVFYGKSRCGKTEVAKELAYRVFTSSPEHAIFWVDCNDLSSMERDFVEISKQLPLSKDKPWEPIERRVWQHLLESDLGSWLLIFDNWHRDVWNSHAQKVQPSIRTREDLKLFVKSRSSSGNSSIIFITQENNFQEHIEALFSFKISPLKVEDIKRSPRPLTEQTNDSTSYTEPKRRVRAFFDSMTSDVGELEFKKGDVIDVIEHLHDTWWKGSLRGQVGSFPMRFMEAEDHIEQSESSSDLGYQDEFLKLGQSFKKHTEAEAERVSTQPFKTAFARGESLQQTKKLVFGLDLDILCTQEKSMVPSVVSKCIQAVETYGMDTSGIYCTTGNALLIDKLQALFDNGSVHVDLQNPSQWYHDIHSVAGLLKQFFTELPDPLLPRDQYDSFIDAARSEYMELRYQALYKKIKSLADTAYTRWCTLKALVLHLRQIVDHQSKYGTVDLERLASIWGPILIEGNNRLSDYDARSKAMEIIIASAWSIFQ